MGLHSQARRHSRNPVPADLKGPAGEEYTTPVPIPKALPGKLRSGLDPRGAFAVHEVNCGGREFVGSDP